MRFHPAHPDYHRTLFNSVLHDPGTIAIGTAIMTGVSTAIQAASTLAQGSAAKEMYNYQANQINQQAGQQRATAQRQAMEQQRAGAYAASRAQAVAANSGAGASDTTVANVEENLAGQTEYNRLSALFTGEERARGLQQQASTDVYSGQQAQTASRYKAIGTLAQGGETLFSKYSFDDPFDTKQPDSVTASNNVPWVYGVQSGTMPANQYTNYG